MSYSDNNILSTSPTTILIPTDETLPRREDAVRRRSPTLRRTIDEEEARERQRALDVDSAMQLSRARSSSVHASTTPGQNLRGPSTTIHNIPSTSSANSSPQSPHQSHLETAIPMLSEAEEQEMHLARSGGGPGFENFLYEEEYHSEIPEPHRVDADRLGRDHNADPRPATYFSPELLMAHRDPMLDADLMQPRDRAGHSYSQHDPVIGAYGSHDPMFPSPQLHPQRSLPHIDHMDADPIFQAAGPSGIDITDATVTQPPMYHLGHIDHYKSIFDFSTMEEFAVEERRKVASAPHLQWAHGNGIGAEIRRRLAQSAPAKEGMPPSPTQARPTASDLLASISPVPPHSDDAGYASPPSQVSPETPTPGGQHRKLSLSNMPPRRQGKLAMFEGGLGPFPPAPPSAAPPTPFGRDPPLPQITHRGGTGDSGQDRPYRFSFYSNALTATIHSRSLWELPSEGQSFEDLFMGRTGSVGDSQPPTAAFSSLQASGVKARPSSIQETPRAGTPVADPSRGVGVTPGAPPNSTQQFPSNHTARSNVLKNPAGPAITSYDEYEKRTWWLDILSPTDEEMKLLSRVFSIHPLTTEDILMEEAREKIELFRNYYFVCFRGFDQDVYSPTHLEPLNMYVIVFREGILSFHFRGTPHPQNVRRRIKQLKDYINVTSDWISYAIIDDITDAFGPLIQNIEYEVDSIDELVLILKDADQSDMLRRIGTCRRKVMGLLRLMGNKADVVKGLAKRCNENWSVAPKSDIGLYLSDIQDHLVTMTQSLNHYEKILSRSHSNYLAQISIEMTDANNQINDVLSKLTALGTVLVPMNLITGMWGMNVHVPGQDITEGYTWFISIVSVLIAVGIIGFAVTYRLMKR